MRQSRQITSFLVTVLLVYLTKDAAAHVSNKRITTVVPPPTTRIGNNNNQRQTTTTTTTTEVLALTTSGNTNHNNDNHNDTTFAHVQDSNNTIQTSHTTTMEATTTTTTTTTTTSSLSSSSSHPSVEVVPPPVPPPPSLHSRPLVVLRTASFLMSVSAALVAFLPAPTIVNQLGSTKATSVLSLIQSSTALCEIFLSPALGSIIDSIGRKPIMLSAITSIAMVNFAVSANPTNVKTLCAAKFANMISTAMHITTSQAVLSDLTSGSSSLMSSALGLQFALVSGGFFMGSFATGTVVEKFGLSASYGISAVGMTCAALLLHWGMPETLHPSNKIPFEAHETRKLLLQAPLSSTRLLMKRGREVRILAILLMLQSFPKFMGDFFQIIAKTEWNLSTADFSRFVGMFGIIGISSNVVGGYLVQKVGVKRFTILSTLSAIGSPLGATIFGFRGLVIGSIVGFLAGAQSLGITATLFSHAGGGPVSSPSSTKSAEDQEDQQQPQRRIPQGELAGERASLLALLKVIGPLFYSTIHIQGQKILGMKTLPWLFNLVLIGITLVISQYYLPG